MKEGGKSGTEEVEGMNSVFEKRVLSSGNSTCRTPWDQGFGPLYFFFQHKDPAAFVVEGCLDWADRIGDCEMQEEVAHGVGGFR